MDVPEPGASADPWGAGAGARAGGGVGAGAAAASEDPWQPYGINKLNKRNQKEKIKKGELKTQKKEGQKSSDLVRYFSQVTCLLCHMQQL